MLNKLVTTIFIAAILAVSISLASYAEAQSTKDTGKADGTKGAAFTANILTHQGNQLVVILTTTGGNFTNNSATVAVSNDNSVFTTVDSVALGENTTLSISYDDENHGSVVDVNPVLFPYIKITVPAITGVTQSATWVVGNK
jgi:hypothetical protein